MVPELHNPARELHRFLAVKARSLAARARRLAQLDHDSVGIRPQDVPFAPSDGHFRAANRRLGEIDRSVRAHLAQLLGDVRRTEKKPQRILSRAALVEREVDRARRLFGLFFDVFSQRGSAFAPALAACDAIAADCFDAVRCRLPGILPTDLLQPLTYLEYSFSPATFRRGVLLKRLLGEQNPFPLVRIPYEHAQSPWGMGVVLHEIGHNLQSDLGIWQENEQAVRARVLRATRNPWLTRIWTRWHKEIFADLISLLLGGPASARAMKDFLAYPASRVLSFRPLGVHPTPYVRGFILAEMLRRMGFRREARATVDVWNRLYGRHLERGRVPQALLASAPQIVPHVVDEVAFQTRRGLGQHALADVIRFTPSEEKKVRRAAREIASGRVPSDLPPRYAVSASRCAFEEKLAPAPQISRTVLGHLAKLQSERSRKPQQASAQAA
jgi:hypothetical protein